MPASALGSFLLSSSLSNGGASGLRDLLIDEVNAMLRYLVSSGKILPNHIYTTAEAFTIERQDREKAKKAEGEEYVFKTEGLLDIEALTTIHGILSEMVAPALPRSIVLLDASTSIPSPFSWISTVPLLRRLMFVAIISLIGFVALALSPYVDPNGGDLFTSDGFPLLVNLLFFIASAGLGASFSTLFQANQYIIQGTFDNKYETSYWIRLLVGIIAGLILACLIPLDPETIKQLNGLGRPMLALLGGFSASLVHRILNLFVDALEGAVKKMANAFVDISPKK
jgi:hypothetical protein